MRWNRSRVVLLGLTALVLAAPAPAAAKEGVEATLKTIIPLDAPAGARIPVAWTLAATDEHGKPQPFDAGGIFMRVVSASGVPGEAVYASGGRGNYAATIVMPKGGIGDVQIGLVGWRSDENGTRRADAIFPITNAPVSGVNRLSPAAADTESPPWLVLVVGGSLALAALAVAFVRRRPLGRFG
jgi:hypothetical protein